MNERAFTSLGMGPEQFFDLLGHVSNLVSKQGFAFDVAVPEALSFTITNEVMDVDGDFMNLKPLFTRDGNFVDARLARQFVEEVRNLVQEPPVLAAWVAVNPAWTTPDQVEQLREAATRQPSH